MSGPSLDDKRKLERGRVAYCLDFLMRSLNDENVQAAWLCNGIPDGTMTDANFLEDSQVEDHAEYVCSQDELDEYVALAARILFGEVYPSAFRYIMELPFELRDKLMKKARCVLT